MDVRLTGGCLCGAVRYECVGPPVLALNCHCRDCQRVSGSSFTASLFVPIDSLTVAGDVRYFDSVGDSGKVISRGFCPNCGSALFGKPSLTPDVISIRPGTLDDRNAFRPVMDIYVASAASWDSMDPTLPKHAKLPHAA